MAVTSGTIHELCLGCGTEAVKGNRRVLSSSSTSLVASSVKYVLIQPVGNIMNTSFPLKNPAIAFLCSSFNGSYFKMSAALDIASSMIHYTCLSTNDYSLIKLMTLHYTRGDTRDVFITS